MVHIHSSCTITLAATSSNGADSIPFEMSPDAVGTELPTLTAVHVYRTCEIGHCEVVETSCALAGPEL